MGDMADMIEMHLGILDAYIDKQYELEQAALTGEVIGIRWPTRDQKPICIQDMTDSHLYNAHALCKRQNHSEAVLWVEILQHEMNRREADDIFKF